MKKALYPILILLAAALACNFATLPTPSGDSQLLFKDDFSSSGSGWDSIRDTDGITDYENGGYRILVDTIGTQGNGMSYWANPQLGAQLPADLKVEVEAAKTAGPDDNEFGVVCRYNKTGESYSFYEFMATSDGYVGIVLVKDGSQTVISGDKLESFEAIKTGAATNRLRADCIGENLTFYVNGQKAASASDATLKTGDVGLIAGTFKEPGTDILFDNFLVTKP
jgi:hypothetical protein